MKTQKLNQTIICVSFMEQKQSMVSVEDGRHFSPFLLAWLQGKKIVSSLSLFYWSHVLCKENYNSSGTNIAIVFLLLRHKFYKQQQKTVNGWENEKFSLLGKLFLLISSWNAGHENDNILCDTENLLIKTLLLVNLHEFEF